jgi:hypothetical protein
LTLCVREARVVIASAHGAGNSVQLQELLTRKKQQRKIICAFSGILEIGKSAGARLGA